MRRGVLKIAEAACVAGACLMGCASGRADARAVRGAEAGEYGAARVVLSRSLTDRREDRDYVLDRVRLLALTLADGLPDAAEETANQTFAMLRTQGLNADRTVASVVFHEGVRIWKGEPFEQALAYYYISVQKAMRGEWDNARAAAMASLFLLRDFGENERGGSEALARRAAERDRRRRGAGDEYLDHGYAAVKTDFALGYIMTGLAARALGRAEEASDNFAEAAAVDPSLAGLADTLRDGDYNTVFVVEYGRGPAKIAYGTDNAFTRFQPRRSNNPGRLTAGVSGAAAGEGAGAAPAVCDVNAMAASLRWNNLEDVRAAKSTLGSVLLIGGSAVALGAEDDTARLVGAGVALAGLLMKGTSSADTRHMEFTPQRVYVMPVNIVTAQTTVTLGFERDAGARMVLAGIDPPPEHVPLQLRYVRMPSEGSPAWATSGRVAYRSRASSAAVEGDDLPFIFGGRDVSPPDAASVDRYHAAGRLRGLTAVELESIYRGEGITLTVEDGRGWTGRHVLEGGDSLVAPLAGTAGFARLFGQDHPAYKARSGALRDAVASESAGDD